VKKYLGHLYFLCILLGANQTFALEESYTGEKKLDVPYREQAVIVTKEGFYPNRLVVFKGEKVRFFVTAVGETSACFNIPSKNVFTTASSGKIAEAETFFDKAGTYSFNCPNNSFSGRVMVIEKAADKEESQRRGLASEVIKVWQPKETPSEWVQIKKDELKELKGMGDVMDLDSK
jgi:plastocyanin domain-containing protein